MKTTHLTILHSNDMHGDFLAECQGAAGRLRGGIPLLSGYINQVRRTEEHVLYAVSGDMLQGSIIDSEFRGISTIEIMNYLSPDVATLGNHEFDYGLPHLLFLEKVANFPIVNANLYMRPYHKRLMRPYHIVERGGLDILFIGIITEKVMADLAKDEQIASFISLGEASEEVGRITDAYRDDDIDLTVLLTHIGHDSDLELASLLKPEWGVDMIIGGHSHTVLEAPAEVNGVLVAQAGVGTDQIGRFDLVVDDDTNRVVSHTWQLVPINNDTAEPDPELDNYIASFREVVDRKYNTILCRLAQQLTHPTRLEETALGNLAADALAAQLGSDVVLVGSGWIRSKELGPLVTLGSFQACFPYVESMTRYTITGAQFRRLMAHVMRAENRNGEGECYQVSRGVRAVYDEAGAALTSLSLHGQPVTDEQKITFSLPLYHARNAERFLDIHPQELAALAPPRVVATSARDVIEEYLREHQNLNSRVEGRLTYC
ncbi:MAG: bifunctional metallophosphatase/5'-nucleotidase [Anaerolineae bacterium]